jgi:hypothetical protein
MPLSVGVPVGVRKNVGLIELDLGAAMANQQWRQGIHPGPMVLVDHGGSKRLGAQGIHLHHRKQFESGQGCAE